MHILTNDSLDTILLYLIYFLGYIYNLKMHQDVWLIPLILYILK